MKTSIMTAIIKANIMANAGMNEIKAWIEEQKGNILVIFVPVFVVLAILLGFNIAASKRGLEDNKPWIRNIIIGGLIITFAATLVTILFG